MKSKKILAAIIDGIIIFAMFFVFNVVFKYIFSVEGTTSNWIITVKEYFWPVFWIVLVLYFIFLHRVCSIGRKIVK